MAENSKIAWCDHTMNFWMGCTKISPACDNCYAEDLMDHRYKKVSWGPHGKRQLTAQSTWRKPTQWNKKQHPDGRRWRVFTLSLGDFFDNQADKMWRDEAWNIINHTENLEWLILTKRPQNIKNMLPSDWGDGYNNVRFGITVENQTEADRRIPIIRDVPAKLTPFISFEPLLGDIDLGYLAVMREVGISQAIIGGESGNSARPMNREWVDSLIKQCRFLHIPVFVKQLGACFSDSVNGIAGKSLKVPAEAQPLISQRLKHPKGEDMTEWPEQLRVQEYPDTELV